MARENAMALIMLACGAIMSAVGLYALVVGYPMIEVERGWASVIAGAVLLSGGLVVASLGIVVHMLARLPVGLVAGPREEPAVAQAAGPEREPVMAAPVDLTPVALTAAPVAAAAVPVLAAHPDVPPAEPEALAPLHAQDFETHDSNQDPRSAPEPEPEEPAEPAWADHDFSAFDLDAPVPPAEPEPHAETAAPPEPFEPHVAPYARAPDQQDTRPEPEPLVAHDAFSHDISPHEALPEALPPHETTPEPVAVQDETREPVAAHEPEPEAPATAPEAPPSNLAVIGRYDSDGTSYVMYSDGSIEAQSESGIYRFTSMAELKAFIEG